MKTPELVRYHTEESVVHALVQHGTVWSHCVWIDGGPLKIRRVRSTERRYMTEYTYDISKGLKGMLEYATRVGASIKALAMVHQAVQEQGL